jgi:hypothetical protein
MTHTLQFLDEAQVEKILPFSKREEIIEDFGEVNYSKKNGR